MLKAPPPPKTIGERVEEYVKLRDYIKAEDDRLEEYRALKERLAGLLLRMLKADGVKSARTEFGTVYVTARPNASCSNPEVFIDYVRTHDRYDLIDRKANVTACHEFAKETGTPPPGVELSIKRTVGVKGA
jgi:hypothetical protein